MRRIPRLQRSIDTFASSSHLARNRINPSPCRAVLNRSTDLRTTSATFSTSTRYNGILDGQRDKKKHQAWVRKWQKRLLGEAEPIGSRVDPFDPSSPVRISPEELGREEEVLEESDVALSRVQEMDEALSGEDLRWVGGVENQQIWDEEDIEELFEKLSMKQFGGFSLFDHSPPITDPRKLRQEFLRAIVEVYTLKRAGKNMDLASYPNRGKFEEPPWIYDVEVTATRNGKVHIGYSDHQFRDLLAQIGSEPPVQEERLEEELEDPADGTLKEVIEEVKAQAEAPESEASSTKKPTPAKKLEQKPFDFMSNRPVPRAKPESPRPAEETIAETIVVESPKPGIEIRQPAQTFDLEAATKAAEDAVAAIRQAVHDTISENLSESQTKRLSSKDQQLQYEQISLANSNIKFALAKRLYVLTGIRISDPILHRAHTLGDLSNSLLDAAKPKPQKLYDEIMNQQRQPKSKARKPLHQLPNVKIAPERQTLANKEKELGRLKVIDYALKERGLEKKHTDLDFM
ncbi:hypothetical protein CC78DRAFT_267444 [Lojkania enalia]|uniref:Large ribosomal subunit protein mL50 n=1 Tax=Lojkania enalia TaxID=147567 RepID=A0A9P4K8N9_9PLEO|nr:hypothetical protein CC78DRAFT_267444 [Didymosphaeria enalia]